MQPSTIQQPIPDLACIVLGVNDQPGLVAAVRSVVMESPRPEVVVVNSGGGDPRSGLLRAGFDVPVINAPGRLYPGAARNRGIAGTSAPFVAFLAGDDLAEPGWVEARLRLHRNGVTAVAAALVNAYRWNPFALASFLLLYHRRMETTPAPARLLYGVSYDRRLFAEYGLFREDLRAGEDSEFNGRLPVGSIAWGGSVRTATRRPRNPASLVFDQARRGNRMARALRDLHGSSQGALAARGALRNLRPALGAGLRVTPRRCRLILPATWVAMPFAVLFYALGALSEPITRRLAHRGGS